MFGAGAILCWQDASGSAWVGGLVTVAAVVWVCTKVNGIAIRTAAVTIVVIMVKAIQHLHFKFVDPAARVTNRHQHPTNVWLVAAAWPPTTMTGAVAMGLMGRQQDDFDDNARCRGACNDDGGKSRHFNDNVTAATATHHSHSWVLTVITGQRGHDAATVPSLVRSEATSTHQPPKTPQLAAAPYRPHNDPPTLSPPTTTTSPSLHPTTSVGDGRNHCNGEGKVVMARVQQGWQGYGEDGKGKAAAAGQQQRR
ncbi:hypothetical protein EDB83DRAFT_2326163 [Lactarius deliciosus]|nr:hypothetical protein EDB83DRAFT_2326163 [Lactarius deliciosus]